MQAPVQDPATSAHEYEWLMYPKWQAFHMLQEMQFTQQNCRPKTANIKTDIFSCSAHCVDVDVMYAIMKKFTKFPPCLQNKYEINV